MALSINVLDYLESSAARFPDKPSFCDGESSLTFRELLWQSKALGTALAVFGGNTIRRPVAVLVDRTVSGIIAFMGALYSGGFYVPIDVEMPLSRARAMLENLNPAAILHAGKDEAYARSLGRPELCVCVEDAARTPIDEELLEGIRQGLIDLDPAYIIFTSGSTGVPKGIVVSHRGVIDLTEWLTDTFSFTEADVLGNQTPFFFDASVKDVYLTLKGGLTTHILPKKLFMFPIRLIEELNNKKVTAVLWATSAINLVANSGVLAKAIPEHVNKVFFAGEAMYGKALNIWRESLPEARYVNLYGPTEITVDCSYYIVDREFSDDEEVPIGRACRNMQLLLLDENLQPVENGVVGEVCVRGSGVALGYYHDPDKTLSAFIQNPANPGYRDLVYRTGDLARTNERGELVFASRKDNQIKRMGHRIELGEIETAANAVEGVNGAICFYDSGRDRIVLVYQSLIAENRAVLKGLADRLPRYMLPHHLYRKENMPYNPNGKIDRVRLKEQYYHGILEQY